MNNMNLNYNKSICVLLNGAIKNDSRVIKTITTMSQKHFVDLFYLNGQQDDKDIFNQNVTLINCKQNKTIINKIVKNSCFYNEYLFFVDKVLEQKKNYDFIWANDLPCLKPGVILKKKLGAKLVYDSHEIYNETLNQFFPENSKGIKRVLYMSTLNFMRYFGVKAENRMVRKADICITVGKYVKDFLQNQFKIDDMKVLYNCPHLHQDDKKVDFRAKLGFEEKDMILLYQGLMNQGRALPEMIQAQKHTNENIKFVLMGDGPIKLKLQGLVTELKLDNKVFFIDRVDSSVLLQYTRGADVGIVLQETEKNFSKKLGIANKFFEYIHAGIPFVATDAPENRLVYNKYKVCKLVNPNHDIIEIAKAIDDLFNDDLMKYKEASKKAAAEYNWDNQEELIHSIIS